MRKLITPYVARALLSPKRLTKKRMKIERRRRRQVKPHRVTIYLRINDAYSYLLIQVLEQFQKRFAIEYDFYTILNPEKDMYPAPDLWKQNSISDYHYLSELYSDLSVVSIERAPIACAERDATLTAQLLHWESQENYLTNALALFKAYWNNDQDSVDKLLDPAVSNNVERYQHRLSANETLLKDQGHYLSAMLHYADEWYWGLDRLHYLEQRLNDLGLGGGSEEILFNRSHTQFCKKMTPEEVSQLEGRLGDKTIEVYFSTRSPYSYLGLVRVQQLAKYYKLDLVIKPVLPMLMRQMKVPKRKGRYILHDANREAKLHNIPFGFIADPLGKGVENSYALFDFAQSQGKGVELLDSVACGVWSQGIRADHNKGLEKLVTRSGLDWNQAKQHLGSELWREWAQANLIELFANGHWGVPCFKYQDIIVFGQDRLDRIESAIASTYRG